MKREYWIIIVGNFVPEKLHTGMDFHDRTKRKRTFQKAYFLAWKLAGPC